MRSSLQKLRRVLAIDPCTRGFGYAVLEGHDQLIDWGVKEVHGNKNVRSLELIERLIDNYQPDVVVVEDCEDRASRRRERIRKLIQKTLALCQKKQVRTRSISRRQVLRAFAACNKNQIAVVVTRHFLELLPWLPPARKPWMSEDYRMSIFDAVAFALAYLQLSDKGRS